jgi:hypothetical protein
VFSERGKEFVNIIWTWFELLTAIRTKIVSLWHVTPSNLVESTNVSKDPAASIIGIYESKIPYTMIRETASASGISVNF